MPIRTTALPCGKPVPVFGLGTWMMGERSLKRLGTDRPCAGKVGTGPQPGRVTTTGPRRVATTVCSYCTVGALGSL